MVPVTVLFALKYKNEGLNLCFEGSFWSSMLKNAGQFNHGDVFIAEVDIVFSYQKKNLDGHSRNELMTVDWKLVIYCCAA